jgi:heme exporter protein A
MTLQGFGLACTRGDRELFHNIDVGLAPGDALRVAGANGSGKTSMLRLLCGLACPSEGEVLWKGRNIRSVREEFGSQLVYLGHANGVKDDLAAWENVAVNATLAGLPTGREQACAALEELGLSHTADLPTRALSQGQRKRVALARLQLGIRQPLWILDEPFTALDQRAVGVLAATMARHLGNGGMVVYTTHQEVQLGAQRMLTLDLGGHQPC